MQPNLQHYEYQPSFILGFHGCDKSTADRVLHDAKAQHLNHSAKVYDWLGSGIYFWEGSYTRALQWAEQKHLEKKIQTPAVIGAVIDLRHCLDLFDSGAAQQLHQAYLMLKSSSRKSGKPMLKNVGPTPDKGGRLLDCAVINTLHQMRADKGQPAYDSVRGPFLEGKSIYPTSGFRSHTHIQICVRDEVCIKGYFRPLVP